MGGGAPWELNGAKPSPTGYELLKTVLWAQQCPYREGDQEGPLAVSNNSPFSPLPICGECGEGLASLKTLEK